MGLRVEVDQQHTAVASGESGGKIDAGRRFPHAAFLVHDGDCSHGWLFVKGR